MTTVETSISIGSLILLVGFAITIITFFRNNKKETTLSVKEETQLRSDVDQAIKDIESIKQDLRSLRAEVKGEMRDLDKQVLSRMNAFDMKLDAIKNLIVEKLGK